VTAAILIVILLGLLLGDLALVHSLKRRGRK
jgi:hypothetical protein